MSHKAFIKQYKDCFITKNIVCKIKYLRLGPFSIITTRPSGLIARSLLLSDIYRSCAALSSICSTCSRICEINRARDSAFPQTIVSELTTFFLRWPERDGHETGDRKLAGILSLGQEIQATVVPTVYLYILAVPIRPIDTAGKFSQTRAASRFHFIIRPGSSVRFPYRCGENSSRRCGIAIFCPIGAAVLQGEPRNDDGTRRVTAARFVLFCQLDFTRLVVSSPFLAFSLLLLLSPRRLGAAESITLLDGSRAFNSTFNSALRYVSPFLCREFLSRSP